MVDLTVAESSDLDTLVGMVRVYYADEAYPFDEDRVRRALAQLVDEPQRGRLWLIRVDGEAAGYLAVTFGFSIEYLGVDAFIDEIYVSAPYRGRGAGTEALVFAERFCREQGVQAVHLEVERSNEKAAALYGRLGFRGNDRVLMSKRLSPESRFPSS